MFRKTDTNPQLDLFTALANIMVRRAQKKYTDEKAWHNQFFKLVTSQIDEETFKPLFQETKMGAPNASVRILVAMSILKEGFGCSDEDLFEKWRPPFLFCRCKNSRILCKFAIVITKL